MDSKLLQQLGDGLREEFKHHIRAGMACAKCGAQDRPLAAHVGVFINGNPGINQRSWVPQATSYAPARGGPTICDRCAPPCKKCQLPILQGATVKWLKSFPGFRPANGFCKEHVRILGFTI